MFIFWLLFILSCDNCRPFITQIECTDEQEEVEEEMKEIHYRVWCGDKAIIIIIIIRVSGPNRYIKCTRGWLFDLKERIHVQTQQCLFVRSPAPPHSLVCLILLTFTRPYPPRPNNENRLAESKYTIRCMQCRGHRKGRRRDSPHQPTSRRAERERVLRRLVSCKTNVNVWTNFPNLEKCVN